MGNPHHFLQHAAGVQTVGDPWVGRIAVVQNDDFFGLEATDDLRGVAGGDELDFRESLFQRRHDVALPGRVKMDVQFVNDDYA
ncbi:hypothetical protein D3C78_1387540 [compost metagenome]